MRSSLLAIVSLLLLCASAALGGEPTRIGFYNLQNYFDTINDPGVNDAQYSNSKSNDFEQKTEDIAQAIMLFNPHILGVCEVEDYGVLEQLSKTIDTLGGRGYAIVHYDSRDSRGIDIAMLYDSSRFELIASEEVKLNFVRRGFVRAEFVGKNGEIAPFVVYAAHLSSKLGGKSAEVRRKKALHILDSLAVAEPSLRAIVCGDMNDEPRPHPILINLGYEAHQNGLASYVYRDVWSMIDQILITPELRRYMVGTQRVVIDNSLITQSGRFKGYPKRNEPSDHLPIFIDIEL